MNCSATKPAVPGDPGQREEDIALKRVVVSGRAVPR